MGVPSSRERRIINVDEQRENKVELRREDGKMVNGEFVNIYAEDQQRIQDWVANSIMHFYRR